jgi:hypothetical protein
MLLESEDRRVVTPEHGLEPSSPPCLARSPKLSHRPSGRKDELVREIVDMMAEHPANCVFSYNYLEKIQGFLVHLTMTFVLLKPYLKGLHQTLAFHLGRRDKLLG